MNIEIDIETAREFDAIFGPVSIGATAKVFGENGLSNLMRIHSLIKKAMDSEITVDNISNPRTKAEAELADKISKRCIEVKCPTSIDPNSHVTHEFATGAKRSATNMRSRPDLMLRNREMFDALAETWAEGFEKYGRDNWLRGFPESEMIKHIFNHLLSYCGGSKGEDTWEQDLAHLIWNAGALIHYRKNKPELMDITGPDTSKSALT